MEEFLNDSPSDYNNQGNIASSNTTPSVANSQYSGNGNNNANYGGSDFSLDDAALGFASGNYIQPDYVSPPLQPVNSDGGYGEFTNPVNTLNDPFLEDLDNLNFPQNIGVGPQNSGPKFINPATTSNLDEIISPQNASSGNGNNAFLNPMYFSPPNRNLNSFNSLNSIAEDGSNDTFSPNSRRESVSVPNNQYSSSFTTVTAPDINSGSYLSPQTNSQYVSPNYDSFDTLRSPSNSYLSSPPQFQNIRVPSNGNNFSSSIPISHNIKSENSNNLLSPPATSNISTSVPSGSNSRDSLPTKQLTKEEKLKRRREFHNAVERRRRDLIKERIKELGLIVPPSLLNPQLCAVQMLQRNTSMNSNELNDLIASIKVKETKPNKSTILNKSVDYIEHLKYVLDQQELSQANLNRKIAALQKSLSTNSAENPTQAIDEFSNYGNDLQPQGNTQGISEPDINTNAGGDSYFNPDDFFSDMISNSNSNINNAGGSNNNSGGFF